MKNPPNNKIEDERSNTISMKILWVKPRSNLVDLCLDDKETFIEDLGQFSSYLVEKDEIK